MNFPNGHRYEGSVVSAGKMVMRGHGTLYFDAKLRESGDFFQGTFRKNSLWHGSLKKKDTHYVGDFNAENKRHGRGIQTWRETGSTYVGTWRQDKMYDGCLSLGTVFYVFESGIKNEITAEEYAKLNTADFVPEIAKLEDQVKVLQKLKEKDRKKLKIQEMLQKENKSLKKENERLKQSEHRDAERAYLLEKQRRRDLESCLQDCKQKLKGLQKEKKAWIEKQAKMRRKIQTLKTQIEEGEQGKAQEAEDMKRYNSDFQERFEEVWSDYGQSFTANQMTEYQKTEAMLSFQKEFGFTIKPISNKNRSANRSKVTVKCIRVMVNGSSRWTDHYITGGDHASANRSRSSPSKRQRRRETLLDKIVKALLDDLQESK